MRTISKRSDASYLILSNSTQKAEKLLQDTLRKTIIKGGQVSELHLAGSSTGLTIRICIFY